ncbi:MAG: hypothetical protein JXB13_03000 [Phycisphaerae bacterium]|nr:hypothetical protein [Phycisphaerae bacterium]
MRGMADCRGALAVFVTVVFVWGLGPAAAQEEGPALVQTVGREGALLSVQNQQGDTIELTIPPGALAEDVEISLRPLSIAPSHAIAAHVFPGVELLPDGLSLLAPAKLELIPATPVADPCMVILYHVRSVEYVVPLALEPPRADEEEDPNDDVGQIGQDELGGEDIVEDPNDEIAGYIEHFSAYGGGEPTPSEMGTLADLAFAMIPPYDPYGYLAFEEALSDILYIKEAIAKLGGDDPFPNKVEEAVLAHLKDFLAEPRPEPPCDPDYIQAAVAYFRIMNLFGLPFYEDDARYDEVVAVRKQMEDLFKEVADRCLRQFNLYINIDVIWTEGLEKNYNGVVNLGWQVMGDDPTYVYGTGELPTTGGGQYDVVTTTFDGVWYVVAEGEVVMATDEAGVMTDLVLELTLSGEVLEEVVSCIPYGCVSVMSNYHYEKSLSLSLKGLASTVVTIEPFEEGTAITTTTLEHIAAPLEQ